MGVSGNNGAASFKSFIIWSYVSCTELLFEGAVKSECSRNTNPRSLSDVTVSYALQKINAPCKKDKARNTSADPFTLFHSAWFPASGAIFSIPSRTRLEG